MLRRVARVLRIVMFAIGLCLFTWWPVSHFHSTLVTVGHWANGYIVYVGGGWLVLCRGVGDIRGRSIPVDFGAIEVHFDHYGGTLGEFEGPMWPPIHTLEATHASWHFTKIPLWLLAFAGLAWPVTSLLLARRRRKGRGFAVEPAAGAAPPAIDPPPHHPSNLPPP